MFLAGPLLVEVNLFQVRHKTRQEIQELEEEEDEGGRTEPHVVKFLSGSLQNYHVVAVVRYCMYDLHLHK